MSEYRTESLYCQSVTLRQIPSYSKQNRGINLVKRSNVATKQLSVGSIGYFADG